MFKFANFQRISLNLVQKCQFAQIPLAKTVCTNKKNTLNKHINQWDFFNNEKIKHQQKLAAARKSTKIERCPPSRFSINSLPDFSKKNKSDSDGSSNDTKERRTSSGVSGDAKKGASSTTSQKPSILTRNLDYITTEEYKRISPEFLELLRRNKDQMKPKNYGEWTNRVRVFEGAEYEPIQDPSSLEALNPLLAQYLRDQMENSDIMNSIYGIDFYNNIEDTDDEDHNPYKFLDLHDLADILNLLTSGGTLSPEELERLVNYLRTLVMMSKNDLSALMLNSSMLGIMSPKLLNYLKALILKTNANITASQLKRILAMMIIPRKKENMGSSGGAVHKGEATKATKVFKDKEGNKRDSQNEYGFENENETDIENNEEERRSSDRPRKRLTWDGIQKDVEERVAGYRLSELDTRRNSYYTNRKSDVPRVSYGRQSTKNLDDPLNKRKSSAFESGVRSSSVPFHFGKRPTIVHGMENFRRDHSVKENRKASVGYIGPVLIKEFNENLGEFKRLSTAPRASTVEYIKNPMFLGGAGDKPSETLKKLENPLKQF